MEYCNAFLLLLFIYRHGAYIRPYTSTRKIELALVINSLINTSQKSLLLLFYCSCTISILQLEFPLRPIFYGPAVSHTPQSKECLTLMCII